MSDKDSTPTGHQPASSSLVLNLANQALAERQFYGARATSFDDGMLTVTYRERPIRTTMPTETYQALASKLDAWLSDGPGSLRDVMRCLDRSLPCPTCNDSNLACVGCDGRNYGR